MKVFLTGVTGFIGSNLLTTLLKRDDKVTCLVRNKKEAKRLKKQGCQVVIGNFGEPKFEEKISPFLKEIDVVFHLAAINKEWGPTKEEFYKTNVLGTKKLLESCLKAQVKHVVITSSAHVLGNPPKKVPASETSPLLPESPYAWSKKEMEKVAFLYYKKGLPITIFRPTFVYGPNDKKGAFFRFFESVKKGKVIIVGSGKNLFQPIYVKDLIKAYFLAVKNRRKSAGKIYILAGKERISLNHLFLEIANALEVKSPKIIKIPKWLTLPLSYPLELIFNIGHFLDLPILRNEPIICPQKVNFISGNHIFTIEKVKRDLGFIPKYTLKEGLKETAMWFKKI